MLQKKSGGISDNKLRSKVVTSTSTARKLAECTKKDAVIKKGMAAHHQYFILATTEE